jgi:DNA-binding beta-propeller fold protein YncE
MTLLGIAAGCAAPRVQPEQGRSVLQEVAVSPRQWTGIAVSREGRIFVNYPLWSDGVSFAVGEVLRYGAVDPFPAGDWQLWRPGLNPQEHFICVQSVVVDESDTLWVLDPANPRFQGTVPNGPKLVRFNLKTGTVLRVYPFDATVAPADSYLNDVRFDLRRGYAYITDSGSGALVVLNLATGVTRRVLAGHPATKGEKIVLTIEGKEWRRPDGSAPQVHADGIALDRTGDYLYFQALTGRTLYRVETRWLRDSLLTAVELEKKVEALGVTGSADGLEFGPDGKLYLTALEENAIKRFDPATRTVATVVTDGRLSWPDSLAFGPDGSLYVTTSQIHRGVGRTEPYRIFRVMPEALGK